MRLFITSLDENRDIVCPFMGIEWDGEYATLKSILSSVAVRDGKIIPFKISVLQTKRELIFSHKVTHPMAVKEDKFFLFDNKVLVHSSPTLSGIFALKGIEG